nr:hypothetical protein [Mesorhizobium tianshanense]
MSFENDPLDLAEQGIGHAVGRAEFLDELLRKIASPREPAIQIGIVFIVKQSTLGRISAAPIQSDAGPFQQIPCAHEKRGRTEVFRRSVATGSDRVGKRRLSGSPRADDRHKARIELDNRRRRPWSVLDRNAGDDLRRGGTDRGRSTDESAPGRIDDGLSERVEMRSAFHPRIAIVIRGADLCRFMRVTAMKTGFERAIAGTYLIRRCAAFATQPEIALADAAGKDNMSKPLDLLPLRAFGFSAHAGGAVMLAAGDGDENVVLGPIDGAIELAQLFEADFELRRAARECSSSRKIGVDLRPEARELVGRACEAIA